MLGTQRRISLDALLILFGLGSWLGVNGVFLQMPLLVQRLPESWALPAWMTLAVQLGNLGIIVYGAASRLLPSISDSFYIYCLLVVSPAALFLNAFFHAETVTTGDTERSFAFLTLVFFTALVGCTSSVLFYPYLRHFRDIYLVTYLVGEGLSGLLPSILALIQGVGGETECIRSPDNATWTVVHPPPRFDTTMFLSILGGMAVVSFLSFIVVQNTRKFDGERKLPAPFDGKQKTTAPHLLDSSWIYLFVLAAILNAINNGVMNAVQSYSCMPYGSVTYHIAVTLKAIANPVVCLAGVWLPLLSARQLSAVLSAATLPLGYVLATALLSPAPPLRDHSLGRLLVVAAWLTSSGALSYARLWVSVRARRGGAAGMRVCGALGQLGSVLGTLAMFLLVNFTDLFTQPPTCPDTVLV